MNQSKISSHQAALQVLEEAVKMLLQQDPDSDQVKDSPIARAKKILDWPKNREFKPLHLLFDKVEIQEERRQTKTHYWPIQSIKSDNSDLCPLVPYPISDRPTNLSKFLEDTKRKIEALELAGEDWQNLSLLTLIVEKYGSFISFGEEDIAFCDRVRSTAALAAALADDPDAKQLHLVAGDLSGIQNFIYTISSDGALKSLRARSFYLELVTEEVVQQLLAELKLPRTSVIYAGGGNLYILASGNEEQVTKQVLAVKNKFNAWLFDEFQGQVFLALDAVSFKTEEVKDSCLSEVWKKVPRKLAVQKQQKFSDDLNQFHKLLKVQDSFSNTCKVCHRDDTNELSSLPTDSETDACPVCHRMYELGAKLLKVKTIIRSTEKKKGLEEELLAFEFSNGMEIQKFYYYFSLNKKSINQDNDTVFLVNNWDVNSYKFRFYKNPVSFFLGQYSQESSEESGMTMRANEFAKKATGIDRVGYVRMDVDNLGQIFAKGLGKDLNLPRLAGLSRMMTYFFKVYLNSLAENRKDNTSDFKRLTNLEKDSDNEKILNQEKFSRQNLLFIYAGGDDLFISGAWDEVVEFSFDIYQSFRAYTGHNPSITLSGGVSLATIKYPLYQAASESGDMEERAKGNGKDSLGLFGQTFKWGEWLGYNDKHEVLDREILGYLEPESQPELLGILPFVTKLNDGETDYPRSFVRNLLNTADLQEKAIKEAEEKFAKDSDRVKDCRYFLHLPRVAYTLSRLPQRFRKNRSLITSLKNPYNAPYFRAIATWIELLNRKSSNEE
ncbi:MAG: type III-A CRISPR-associated protein Cas10/Csm1 [Spirulina sp.]